MLIRLNAPPLNRSKKPRSSLFRKRLSSCTWSIPGRGMWAMNRYRARIAKVKSILARRSGRLKASIAACISLGNLPAWVSAFIITPRFPPQFLSPLRSSLWLTE